MTYHPLRSSDIRLSNEKLVLNLIFHDKQISQSQVVQRTGLKAPTVFRIFAKLEEAGFIQSCTDGTDGRDSGQRKTERKGRRPNYYCIVPNSGYAVGVDFSSLAAAVIVVDFRNQVIHHDVAEFATHPERDDILSTIDAMIQNALGSASVAPERLIGIGIAAPGVVDTVSGRVVEYARISGLTGFPLKDHFEGRYGVPVEVHNNASVIAAGAYHYGAAREENSLLAVLVRSGVGGALVTNGRVFLNGTRTAIEVGRTAVRAESFEQLVTNGAVLESYVAEQPLLRRVRERYPVESWEEVQERLSRSELSTAVGTELLYFATAVRNLGHIFHPEAVLLISRFEILSEVLGDAVRKALPQRRVIPMVYDPVQACYGATDMVFQQFFRLPGPGE